MKMHRVRLRFLAAMGLPAMVGCSSSSGQTATGAAPTDAPPVEIAPDDSSAPLVVVSPPDETPEPAGAQCGEDVVKEEVCGGIGEQPDCGANGKRLTSFGGRTVLVEPIGMTAHNPAYQSFGYDEEVTADYRDELRDKHKHIQNREAYCCYSRCTSLVVAAAFKQNVPGNMMPVNRCIPAPATTSVPADGAPRCPAAVELAGKMRPFSSASGDQCCYQTLQHRPKRPRPPRYRGRPMRIEGEATVAGVRVESHRTATHGDVGVAFAAASRTGRGWAGESFGDIEAVPPASRREVAEAWLEEGRLEHASVAAFAKLSLELCALGAPPDLIDAAHAAARDEVEHARRAFSIAAALTGEPRGPAPMERWGHGSALPTMASLVRETVLDGCVGETAAGFEAAEAARRAASEEMRAVLEQVADDELRHAELGFAVVAWCVREDEAARSALVEVMSELERESLSPTSRPCCEQRLSRFGILCDHERAAIRARALSEVVLPCLRALVG